MFAKRYYCFVLALFFWIFAACGSSGKSTSTRTGKTGEEFQDVFAGVTMPETVDFKIQHMQPIAQHYTGTCWSFSTTSFIESELIRLGHGKFKLSEMYVAYYTYLEKAKNYLRNNGKAVFGQGGLGHDWIKIVREYGIVRYIDYTGLNETDIIYNHRQLVKDLKDVLDTAIAEGENDEDVILQRFKKILTAKMGRPPETIEILGKTFTPKEFADEILRIPYDDYVEVMSFSYTPFFELSELTVPDNWWHFNGYYNVPLEMFMKQMDYAVKSGYSTIINEDYSNEDGYDPSKGMAIIPLHDIPADQIDQEAREERFTDGRTVDDHLVHIVGRKVQNGDTWYLIKGSEGGMKSPFTGYFFMREDYFKLKVLSFMIHRDILMPEIKALFGK